MSSFFKKFAKKKENKIVHISEPSQREILIKKLTEISFTQISLLDKISKLEEQLNFIQDAKKFSELQILKQQERNQSKLYLDIYISLSY